MRAGAMRAPRPRRLMLALALLLLAGVGVGAYDALQPPDPVVHATALGLSPPTNLALDPRSGHVFVVGWVKGTDRVAVDMLALRDGAAVRATPLPNENAPHLLALAPRAGLLYVADHFETTLDLVSTRDGRLVRRLDLVRTLRDAYTKAGATSGAPPGVNGLVVDEASGRLFVLTFDGVATLDLRGERLVGTTTVVNPIAAAVDERIARVFVLDQYGNVAVLDARSGARMHTALLNRAAARMRAIPAYWIRVQLFGVGSPLGVAAAAGHVFVSALPGVAMLDARSGALLRLIPAPLGPVADDAPAGRVVVADAGGGDWRAWPRVADPDAHPHAGQTLLLLDARSGRPLRTVALPLLHNPDALDALAVDDARRRVYLTGYGQPRDAPTEGMGVVDARTGVALDVVCGGRCGRAIGVDARTGHVVTAAGDGVALVDPTRR